MCVDSCQCCTNTLFCGLYLHDVFRVFWSYCYAFRCLCVYVATSPVQSHTFFFAKISSFVKSCFSFQVLGCRSVAGLCTVWCGDSLAFFIRGTCHVSTDRRCTAVGSMIPDSGPLYRLLGGLRFMRHNGGRTVSVET